MIDGSRVAMTGATGLLGAALAARLRRDGAIVLPIERGASAADYQRALADADAVLHLAGVTSSPDPLDFDRGNRGTTAELVAALEQRGGAIQLLYASSTRVVADTLYGASKRAAEALLRDYSAATGSPVALFRLPSFFGTWSRPNYNSAIATFCHQAARRLPIDVRTPEAPLQLVDLDVPVEAFVRSLAEPMAGVSFPTVAPTYETSVGQVAELIEAIAGGTDDLPDTAPGLVDGLRRTYAAHLARLATPSG